MGTFDEINAERSKLLAKADKLESELSAIYLNARWVSEALSYDLRNIELQLEELDKIEREKAAKLRNEITSAIWDNPDKLSELLNS